MLEVVNCVEQHGLLRQKDAHCRYVRGAPLHSWNSNHLVGNLLLYLQHAALRGPNACRRGGP